MGVSESLLMWAIKTPRGRLTATKLKETKKALLAQFISPQVYQKRLRQGYTVVRVREGKENV